MPALWVTRVLALILIAPPVSVAFAQTFPIPSKPIRIVVPSAPGGAADIRARQIGPFLRQALGTSVFVENRPGANGLIAAQETAKGPPDGHTLVLGTVQMIVLNDLYAIHPTFRASGALIPVTGLAAGPVLVLTHPSLPVTTFSELIALAKARPGSLSYSTTGRGTPFHLLGEMIKLQTGIDIVDVPYKGAGLDVSDLVSGHIPLGMAAYVAVGHHVKSGKLKVLAVSSTQRLAVLPDVPTLSESGFPGLETRLWLGFFAPTGTLDVVVRRLQSELSRIIRSTDIREQIVSSGSEVGGESPEEYAAFIKAETVKWGQLIRDRGIKIN